MDIGVGKTHLQEREKIYYKEMLKINVQAHYQRWHCGLNIKTHMKTLLY